MKSKIKKTLLISGIAILGLMGVKHSYDTINDDDNAKKIEYAQGALQRVNQELASDSLNPEERHELILTRNEIQKEIDAYSQRQKTKNDNGADIAALTTRLEFAQNVLAHIENELKSDSINPEQRHELILTRTNVQREIQELRQQISSTRGTRTIPVSSREK
ncbi:MAG: hypothetical protein NC311_04505 [Muribaculaceae bacterium]|nr:hypothetical protein [Muribaculaceae bacterium]